MRLGKPSRHKPATYKRMQTDKHARAAGMLAADALGSKYIPLFSGVLTLAILLLSEILPKTYGATHWRKLWPAVVWPLLALEKLLRPLIWATQAFFRSIHR